MFNIFTRGLRDMTFKIIIDRYKYYTITIIINNVPIINYIKLEMLYRQLL